MTEEFGIERLLLLRRVTRAVSDWLSSQLKEQLDTISPLMRPRRLLGDYIESGSPEPVLDADKNFAALSELYVKAAGPPFDLPRPLRPPLKPVGLVLDVYPWEYDYQPNTGDGAKVVTVTSPVKFVMCYASGLSLSRLRAGVAGREKQKPEDIREFVIRCCVMQLMMNRLKGLASLLRALRWEVAIDTLPDLGGVPLMTLTAPVRSMLPPDHLILESTEMSGSAFFEEVVDIDAVGRMRDPLSEKVHAILETMRGGR